MCLKNSATICIQSSAKEGTHVRLANIHLLYKRRNRGRENGMANHINLKSSNFIIYFREHCHSLKGTTLAIC